MSAPKVTITVLDGTLGQVAASSARSQLKIGVCSGGVPNAFYSQADNGTAQRQLGSGPLLEAVSLSLSTAGGPCFAIPSTPTGLGTVGSTTQTGGGAGTVTASAAPAVPILVLIFLGGPLGTAQIQVNVGGQGYQPPVLTTAGTFSYLVPGTLTTITLANQSYTQGAVWTIAPTGVISLTGTGTVGWVTQASSTLDAYSAIITVQVAGALGVGVFSFSVDGGNTPSANIQIPSSGVYAIPGTGIVLTFASTFVAGDFYTFSTTTATTNNTAIVAAFTAAFGLATTWGFAHVAATPANAAAAAVTAAAVDAQMSIAQVAFRYVFTFTECPQAEGDTTVFTAFANFLSARISVGYGDVGAISSINGQTFRRNCAWIASAHCAGVNVGEDLAWVESSVPIKNVVSLYRDEAKTPGADDARFTTMTTIQGTPGYFITNARTMAAPGSDFSLVQYRRVMDVACTVSRAILVKYLSSSVRVNTDPNNLANPPGSIDERDARRIENRVTRALVDALIATSQASAVSCVVSRTQNILSSQSEPVSIAVVPLGYLKEIDATIGFSNPALN